MSLYLKNNDDIATVIADAAYSAIPSDRRNQLANNFKAMPSADWQAALAVMVSSAPTWEANFCLALFADAPAGPGTTPPTPLTDRRVASVSELAAIATATETGNPVMTMVRNNQLSSWQLVAGSDAHDPDHGIIRPGDWANGNAKVWKEVL